MAILKFFASVKDRMGTGSMEINLPESVTLRKLMQKAAREANVDEAALLNPSLLYAVNQETTGLDAAVGDSDEIAVLPPLSGGA